MWYEYNSCVCLTPQESGVYVLLAVHQTVFQLWDMYRLWLCETIFNDIFYFYNVLVVGSAYINMYT